MSKFFSKSLDIKVDIIDPPPSLKYSPANPVVEGTIKIQFNESVKKISHICCGIQGKAQMTYYATNLSLVGLQTTMVNRRLILQNIDFFNVSMAVPLDCENGNEGRVTMMENKGAVYNYNAGESLECKFNFKFPLDAFLPSSTKSYGTIDAEVGISYELYVDVYKIGKFLNKAKSFQSYSQTILFQSGIDPRIAKNIQTLKYMKDELFKNKLKKFYFDEEKNALIPNSMSKSHSKTKFIRQLWDNNYKTENYTMNTKTIPITLKFQVESFFDLEKSFSSQISLTLLSNLKSADIFSNQTTDFVLNGQSTGLGVIKIESLRVESRNFITLQHHQFLMKENSVEPILKIQFKDLLFDIKDFEYNKGKEVYEKEVDIGTLVEAADYDLNQSLVELLGDRTVMCTGVMEGWLQNMVQLTFIWKISDSNGSNSKRIEFLTTSTPDFLLGMSNFGPPNSYSSLPNIGLPPPTYEMSKSDVPIVNESKN